MAKVDRMQRTLHFIKTLYTADRFSGRLSVVVETPKVNLRSPKLKSAKNTVGGLDGHGSSGQRRARMMSGGGIFRQGTHSHKVTATRLAATDFYNFTEITITILPLTRIIDCLIRGGIILCDDIV
jgi:hypothetical protein